MDLTGWTYLLTFGYDLDLYANGNQRVAIDRETGEIILSYVM